MTNHSQRKKSPKNSKKRQSTINNKEVKLLTNTAGKLQKYKYRNEVQADTIMVKNVQVHSVIYLFLKLYIGVSLDSISHVGVGVSYSAGRRSCRC